MKQSPDQRQDEFEKLCDDKLCAIDDVVSITALEKYMRGILPPAAARVACNGIEAYFTQMANEQASEEMWQS